MSREFTKLSSITKCPYARSASVVAAPDWDYSVGLEENAASHARAIAAFAERVESERLHGFVAKVGTSHAAPDFEAVRVGFRGYLMALAGTDRTCAESMLNQDFMSTDWQFTHSSMRFFLNVFSSCYPQPHSKYCDVDNGFLVFFQPEVSFDYCGGQPLDVAKHAIRARFASAGMPYDGDRIDRRIEALLYMFPIEPFGEAVAWWTGGT